MHLWNLRKCYLGIFMVSYVLYHPTDSGAVSVTKENIDMILASNELVFLNFYASWCHFSNQLMPNFEEADEKVKEEFKEAGKVVMGKVDCDKENALVERFRITKFPTLKIVRNGEVNKREYRGKRTADAFLEYVRNQLEDPIKEFDDIRNLSTLDKKKRVFIGYFDRRDQPEYSVFRKAATNFKDDCEFHVGFGKASEVMHPPGTPIIVFRPDVAVSPESDETYKGSMDNISELRKWIQNKCVPLVREITFENAEELTEEGLPILILFYNPNDTESIIKYKKAIEDHLMHEKQNINFVTADGRKFTHPLHHLNKSERDLPLIAIDSFRHMYLFPSFDDMDKPGKLKQFIEDLHSGKLHREFHYGPDPTTNEVHEVTSKSGKTPPPESVFKKLGPSKNRYTLVNKDEL